MSLCNACRAGTTGRAVRRHHVSCCDSVNFLPLSAALAAGSSAAPTLGVHESRLPQRHFDTCSPSHRYRRCSEMLQGCTIEWGFIGAGAPPRRTNPFPTTRATLLPPHRRHHGLTARRMLGGRRGPATHGAGAEFRPNNRSDNKGPKPERVAVGRLGAKTFAFIGLERVGGIMVNDITSPTSPSFVTHANSRIGASRDLAPEGIVFVPAVRSPNKRPLLIVGYETSGSVGVFEIVPQ